MNFLVDSFVIAGNWITNILDVIFMAIDSIVYKALAAIYEIFMALCRLNLSAFDEMFSNLTKRLYLILGIVMLFVISFNLLKMLVEPDKANDSHIGGPAMAKHIFLSLVMLIAFPFVFDLLDEAQNAILDGNVIETIVLGDGDTSLSGETAGPSFSWTLFSSFFRPADGSQWSSSNSYLSSKIKDAYDKVWVEGSNGEVGTYSLKSFTFVASDSTVDYTFAISTIIGIVVAIQLLKFCITVGKRAFRLLFLQLLAPIPIISYMDPNKGTKVFNSYVSEYISTYIELFVNIFILFLGILLSNKVMIMFQGDDMTLIDASGLSWFSLNLARALLVIAIFKFADEVPTMFNNVFGTKFKGTNGGFGKAVAGALGFAGGAAIGGAGALAGSLTRGDLKFGNFKDDVTGKPTLKSFMGGARTTLGSFGKVTANAIGGATKGGVGGAKTGYGTGINAKGLKAMGAAGIAGIAAQHNASLASTEAGGFFAKQKGRLDKATGGEYRIKKAVDNREKTVNAAQKAYDSSKENLAGLGNIRAAYEKQYAASLGRTVQENRDIHDKSGADYDFALNNYIKDFETNAPEGSSARDAVNSAIENYNAETGKNVEMSTFASEYSNAKKKTLDTQKELTSAKSDLSTYKDSVKDRQKRIDGYNIEKNKGK